MPLVTGTCAHCGRDRLLKYARRTMCATYACQRAAAAEVATRKAGTRGDGERESKAPPVFCYKILSVNGERARLRPSKRVDKNKRNKAGKTYTRPMTFTLKDRPPPRFGPETS